MSCRRHTEGLGVRGPPEASASGGDSHSPEKGPEGRVLTPPSGSRARVRRGTGRWPCQAPALVLLMGGRRPQEEQPQPSG